MRQLTKEEAIALGELKVYENMTAREIVELQLFQDLMCMPFSVFHHAVEEVLGRPVFTHEFGSGGNIVKEFLGEKAAPTFEEIIALIPEEKRIVIKL